MDVWELPGNQLAPGNLLNYPNDINEWDWNNANDDEDDDGGENDFNNALQGPINDFIQNNPYIFTTESSRKRN